MTGKIKNFTKRENGAVSIVEATIIFPIMFLVLFFLIYAGNAYYLRSQIESIVEKNAIAGAGYCADPILETIKGNKENKGKVPEVKELHIKPYRYLFGGMNDVEKKIARNVEDEIKDTSVSFFKNMKPVLKTKRGEITKYNNYVLYSTFSVGVECEVEFPIKFLGSATPSIMKVTSYAEIAVDDTSEFIRNSDMAIDYFCDTKFGESVKGVFDKINTFLGNFK